MNPNPDPQASPTPPQELPCGLEASTWDRLSPDQQAYEERADKRRKERAASGDLSVPGSGYELGAKVDAKVGRTKLMRSDVLDPRSGEIVAELVQVVGPTLAERDQALREILAEQRRAALSGAPSPQKAAPAPAARARGRRSRHAQDRTRAPTDPDSSSDPEQPAAGQS